ncbi:MAG: hypothetical protein IPP27_11830 [Bacteroidetes bacterium]|nr:hypothetical protein [Bacteroidota bacterium]MBL0032819.1 hypothetical protein [Bacteroidota bacterium]
MLPKPQHPTEYSVRILMQSPILHQQLILSTERLRDLHRSMQAHSSAIPAAEMDVFLAEIRKVYELALQLNYQNALQLLNEMQVSNLAEMKMNFPPNPAPANVIPNSPVANHTSEIIPEIPSVKENIPVAATNVPSTPEPIRKEEISEAPVEVPGKTNGHISMDKLMADISKSENAAEINHLKKSNSDLHEMFASSPSIAHKFEDHETLADRIAMNQSSHSVSDHLHKVPVKDLKAAIGLNEKFQFINQLFNGDSQKYNSSVEHLNTCGSSNKAQEFMKTISLDYNWEKQPSVASLFMDIVERRYLG